MKYSEKHCIITFCGDGNTIIEGKCLLTEKDQKITVRTDDYEAWVKDEQGDVKSYMPYLSTSESKFLESGVTDEGWNMINIPKLNN